MPAAGADYDARWGYRHLDAARYERRRYGGLLGRVNLHRLRQAVARGLGGVRAGGRVLDTPCGTGILAPVFAARGLHALAMDISLAMLGVAHQRGYDLGWVRGDLESPPCRPASLDAVVCVRFIMHVPAASRPRLLRTLAGLTDGPLLVTVTHPYTVKQLGRAVRRALGGRPKSTPRLDRAALAREVAAAGLRVERIIPVVPFLSDLWLVVLRRPAGSA
jgi:SAM-dependent methyltransferase